MPINVNDLRRIDLNLLPVFITLMQERSLTRAAAVLNLGQPAVSAALKRLRETLDDELLYRTPRGMEPTTRALELKRALEPLLREIHGALQNPQPFDPATEQRVFRIGMPDNHEYFLMPRLLRRLQQTAPGIRVVVRPLQRQAVAQMLDQGDIDLACGRLGELPKWQTRERLLDVGFLCLYDGKRLKIRKPISLARFLELPHLLFSAGGDMEGVVDRVLATRNLQRKVIYATSSFSVMPALLKQVDAIATLPEYTAREFAADSGLRISPAPIPLPRYPSSLAWLSQRRDDPAHTWLREEIKGIIARMVKAGG